MTEQSFWPMGKFWPSIAESPLCIARSIPLRLLEPPRLTPVSLCPRGRGTLKDTWNATANKPYSSFLNQLVSFLCIGTSLYGLAHIFQFFSREPIIKHTVKCKYCRKRISDKVRFPMAPRQCGRP